MPSELQQEVSDQLKLLVASNSSRENINNSLKRLEYNYFTLSTVVALGVYSENYEELNSTLGKRHSSYQPVALLK